MIISGFAYRNLYSQNEGFSFRAGITFSDTVTTAKFGFSGQNTKVEFTLASGKIRDWNDNFVSIYNPSNINQPVYISGIIGADSVDYHINNEPVAFGMGRSTGVFDTIYVNSYYGAINLDLAVYGQAPNYTIDSPISFQVSDPLIPITIRNYSDPFVIFSGDLTRGQNQFSLDSGISGVVNSQSTFLLKTNTGNQSAGQQNIGFRLYTNFGIIDPVISVSGALDPFSGLSFSLTGPNAVSTTSPSQFFCHFSNSGNQISVVPYLQHLSGSGVQIETANLTGGYDVHLGGFITYSGELTRQGSITGFGFGSVSNQFTSGVLNYNLSAFQWAVGDQISTVIVPGTGIGITQGYTGLASGLISGTCYGTIVSGSGYYHASAYALSTSFATPHVYSINPTGGGQATGAIYYNTPSGDDVLYIRDYANPIINNYHYTSIDTLTSYINSNTGSYYVTGTRSGSTIYLTSLLSGDKGNSSILSLESFNLGNMAVSAPSLQGGFFVGFNAPLSPTGGFLGYIDQDVLGTGFYLVESTGIISGTVPISSFNKTFTGTWDLQTGVSADTMLDYRDNGWISSPSTYIFESGKLTRGANSFYASVTYDGLGTGQDMAILYLSGLGTNHFISKVLQGVR